MKPGDRVYWTDPDAGLCSGNFTVQEFDEELGELVLVNKAGSEAGALLSEVTLGWR